MPKRKTFRRSRKISETTMKAIAITLLILLLSPLAMTLSAQGSWQRESLPVSSSLRTICFTDSLHGWLAGEAGVILHTADGGKSWVQQSSGIEGPVASIFFLDTLHGWASAFSFDTSFLGTWLLSTNDGGATWSKRAYPQENIFITCLLYFDTLTGWMGGKPHALVKTTDGGVTWHQAAIDTSILAFMPVLSINFWDEQTGYASGGMFDIAGVVWRTTNGGENWSAMDAQYAPADEVHALHLFSDQKVMGAGGDPDFGYGVGMIRTWDGGDHWSYQELGMQGNAYDLAFRNESEVWAPLGQQRKMIVSMDTGTTWTAFPTPDTAIIYRVTFTDSLHGYATGANGAFLRYIPRDVGLAEAPTSGEELITLSCHPNPFGASSAIHVNITPGETTNLNRNGFRLRVTCTDLPGRTVQQWITGTEPSGDHRFLLDGSSLKPGIYLCVAELLDDRQVIAKGRVLKLLKK